LSKIYIKDAIFFGIYIYKFIIPEIYLGDSLLSGDILLSPTKGEGPLVRASSPTITAPEKIDPVLPTEVSLQRRKIYLFYLVPKHVLVPPEGIPIETILIRHHLLGT
jgi:hypothetical protein